jgi:hypothetical protein
MWTYEQVTGVVFAADGTRLPAGYAGNGLGKNNPAMQQVKNVGPLPCGFYTIGPLVDDPVTGEDSMHLIPDPTDDEYDRNDFLIHGDGIKDPGHASDGCMVQSRPNRIRIGTSEDTRLQVVSGLATS